MGLYHMCRFHNLDGSFDFPILKQRTKDTPAVDWRDPYWCSFWEALLNSSQWNRQIPFKRNWKFWFTLIRPYGKLMPSRLQAEIEAPQWQKSALEWGLPSGFVTPEESHSGAACFRSTETRGKDSLREVHGELSPMAGTPCWSRGRVGGVLTLRRKEW